MKGSRYTVEEVDLDFGGFGLDGFGRVHGHRVSEGFRIVLVKALSKLPKDIVDWANNNLLFFSSSDDYLAFCLQTRHWKHKQGFIFLSEGLFSKSEPEQAFIIAHEIAHAKLKHPPEYGQQSEEQADKLAKQWLKACSLKQDQGFS
jgi:hypothetical protein